jgi:hypothetical protein
MVLRSVLGAAAVMSLVLVPGPVRAGASTYAKPRPDPLAELTLHPEWGSITAEDGRLRRGCRGYTYSYAITPPEGIWAIEVYVSGPGVKHLAGGAFLDGYDPETGSGHYTLCRNTTRSGVFTIQAKLSTDDGAGHITEGRLPADTYVLLARRR